MSTSLHISWGADDEPGDQVTSPEAPDAPRHPGDHQFEDHPCAKCGEEHRAQLAELEAEIKKQKDRAIEAETALVLRTRHLEEVKQNRMELRNENAMLLAENELLKAELEKCKQRGWWKGK